MDTIKNTIIGMVLFIISGTIHEFAHAFSAYILGDDTARLQGRLTLNPIAHIDLFGSIIFPIISSLTGFYIYGWMKPVPVSGKGFKNPARDHAVVSFAGPLSNLLQVCIGIIFLRIMDAIALVGGAILENPVFINFQILFQYYFIINIILFTFNLFPCPPLDGGWILRYILPGNLKNVFDKFYGFGFIILFILLFTGLSGIILTFMVKLFFGLYEILYKYNILAAFLPLLAGLTITGWLFRKELMQLFKHKGEAVNGQANNIVNEFSNPDQSIQSNQPDPATTTNNTAFNPDSNQEFPGEKPASGETGNCNERDFKKDNSECLQCTDYMSCLYKDIQKKEK